MERLRLFSGEQILFRYALQRLAKGGGNSLDLRIDGCPKDKETNHENRQCFIHGNTIHNAQGLSQQTKPKLYLRQQQEFQSVLGLSSKVARRERFAPSIVNRAPTAAFP
jgi:hypothetical protein